MATSWANFRRLDDGFQYDHSIPQVPKKMSVCGLCGLFHLSVGNLKSTPFHQEFFHSWRPQAIETWPRSSSRSCYVYCTSKNVCSSAMVMTHDHPMVPYGSIWSRGFMTYPLLELYEVHLQRRDEVRKLLAGACRDGNWKDSNMSKIHSKKWGNQMNRHISWWLITVGTQPGS